MKWFRFKLTKLRKAPLRDRIILFYITAIRRPFYSIFKKEYIKKNLGRRKGECKKCGKCCEVMDILSLKCKYFKEEKCTIFKDEYGKNVECDIHQYPFDEKDKTITKKHTNCGFYWN